MRYLDQLLARTTECRIAFIQCARRGLGFLDCRLGSSPLAARMLSLLVLLVVLKGWLLLDLSPHLYHTHWRLMNHFPTGLDWLSFASFLGLVVISFVMLGRQLAGGPPRRIRLANAGFALAGLLLVVLTFKRVNSNYLYPVMTGALRWRDVGYYLSQDFFFETPYLSIYVFGYALLYWILARTGREHWSLHWLGTIAAIYAGLNLRVLMESDIELFVMNCFGWGGVLSYAVVRRPLPWVWWLLPPLLAVTAWGLFARVDPSLWRLEPYFANLLALVAAVVAVPTLLARRSPAYPLLSHLLPFYAVAFLIIANCNYPRGANYNHLIAYGLTLPHYFWQELLLVGLGGVLFSMSHRTAPRAAARGFDAVALGAVVLALLDLRVTQTLGVRLDWHALVMNTDPVLLWRTLQPFLGALAAGVGVVGAAYYGIAWAAQRWALPCGGLAPGRTPRAFSFGWATVLVLAFATPLLCKPDKGEGLALTHILTTSPLLDATKARKYNAQEFDALSQRLGFGSLQAHAHPATPRGAPADLNVLLILMESSYNRYLSLFGAADETQPQLKRYRDRMELFPNFYANWPCSINARFTLLTGLYAPSTYATEVNPHVEVQTLPDILHDRGYVVSLFYSSFRHYQQFNDFLQPRKLDFFYDAETMPGKDRHSKVSWGVSESATLEAILGQLTRHAQRKERFFLTYIPAAPHMPYDTPSKEFDKFDNGAGSIDGNYTGRYKNQLLYMDFIITSMLDELRRLGLLDRTLVVLTNDHGEMVGEDEGHLGHGWNLEPRLANVPLIVLDPRRPGYRLNTVLGSHVDVLPTLLDLLNVPLPGNHFYQGVSLYDETAIPNKVVYLNSLAHRALIQGAHYCLERREQNGRGAAASPVEVYEISFDGPKTRFTPVPEHPAITAQLDRLDEFQHSLLVHYGTYRQFLTGSSSTTVHARTRRAE